MAVDRRQVLRGIEGEYLLDYAVFTGAVRAYVTQGLEEHFRKDPNDLHRRMFLLAVFREEYSAYEDLGAFLDALLTNRRSPDIPLLERLISYRPGEVALSKVINRFEVASGTDLCDRLGLMDLIPSRWGEEFPQLDLSRAFRTAADFFFVDCQGSQKTDGVRAFNKLKHGLTLVPLAARYVSGHVDAPAALFATDADKPEAATNPISVYGVPMEDEHIEARLRAIHFVQTNLRMIAAMLAVHRHPGAVMRRHPTNALDLFRTRYLVDVINFIGQLSQKTGSGEVAG